MSASTVYLTTPIYYVNDRPHIGHVYTTTVADIYARYQRLCGRDVFFLTGTDEHAAKVVDAAAERGLTTQAWADQNARAFEETFQHYGISNDDFIRTSQQRHVECVQRYVAELLESGDVYLGEYEGWYDAGQEEYVPEAKAAEHDYRSPINGKPLVRKREQNYFFRLSTYADVLLQLLEERPDFVSPPARRNEVIGRIREGLADVPISRSGASDWGIRMPGDAKHVVYVWIDALFNYLTAIDSAERRRFWPPRVHFIAKDILWFHAVIWPALLLALRRRRHYTWVELPRTVYAHSFWISEGKKMSKSLGNFVDLEKLDRYAANFSLDALRFFLATQGPLGTNDSDFSAARFTEVYNADLANGVGNCVSRVANMMRRYTQGRVGSPDAPVPAEAHCRAAAERAVQIYREAMNALDLERAATVALELVRAVDAYIEESKPFQLAKRAEQIPQVAAILYRCVEALRIASLLLWPVMPGKMEELWRHFGWGYYTDTIARSGLGCFDEWVQWGQLEVGSGIEPPPPLFPRHEEAPPIPAGAA